MGWVFLAVAFSFVFCLGWALGAAVARTGALSDGPAPTTRDPWAEALAPDTTLRQAVPR